MKESFEKNRFVQEHTDEIRPLISQQELDAFHSGTYTEEMLDDALEKYENKLFLRKNAAATEDAERVLMTTSDPGSYNASRALIEALLVDPRCKELDVVTGGVADTKFQETFGKEFTRVRNKDSFLKDLDAILDEGPIDIALGTISVTNGPESLIVYDGKQLLGAKKVFFVFEGWGTLGSSFGEDLLRQDKESGKITSTVDGFFCNDELAKKIIHRILPAYPLERIFATGTPVLDSLENEKSKEYRTATRAKLGISENDLVALYLGDAPGDYPNADPQIQEKTLLHTYEALSEVARTHPDRSVVLLYRPHPRKPELPPELGTLESTASPVKILFGSSPLSINEATAASDIVMSLASTENMLAPLRGKRSAYLAYQEKGLGADVLEHFYGADMVEAMGNTNGVSVVRSEGDVARVLEEMLSGGSEDMTHSVYAGNASKKILDVVFNEK